MNFEIEVNSKIIQARKGDTILDTLNKNAIRVPTLCNLKGLSPTGACRICVVEVEGITNLVTSCSYPVREGMKIQTHSPRVVKARKTLVELLLSNHPDDCLYCERNGNCELQDLAVELNIRERRISGKKPRHRLDLSSPSVVRDPAKCILCGRCVRTCDEIQSVSTLEFLNRGSKTVIGTTMNRDLNFSSCIACGQCVMVCPTGALHEHSNLDEILDALNNKSLKVVLQFGPAVTVSLAEEFGLKSGKDINGLLVAALRKIGFDFIFDTTFAADLTVMESVAELAKRYESNQNLPMISSCCPAWVKFAEQFYPELLPLLSTCKSPQQMMGSIIKNYFAQANELTSNQIFSVSVMPCLAKKFESQRPEMTSKGLSDVDLVLSTRELARLIRLYGIDIQAIDPQLADNPFGTRSSAGKLFASSGGTAEGIARTLHFNLTGKEMVSPKINDLRSVTGVKQVDVKVGKDTLKFIVANGLTDLKHFLEAIKLGEINAHYIEIMACKGGCVNGGGQPFGSNEKDVKQRAKAIYELDEIETIKCAHKNPSLLKLYDDFLGKPNGEKSQRLLHVKYTKREVLL
ncbi:MAG TPA: 4Fe-4S dicluster domain-containing protein [Bacteroidetes bacterium]|nr:4Fe-4S dicluster domain-containing protein [Bacteroidota bacterium]